jgi:ABC-type dipeptide/oligopeptide/nickel transport system permease subunit
MQRLIGVIVVVWLVIGVLAAFQRGYLTGKKDVSCHSVGDTVLTIVAGPLDYLGVNPKVSCHVPQPSK